MLVEFGDDYGLVCHSEWRQYHHESSELVERKFSSSNFAVLRPNLFVG